MSAKWDQRYLDLAQYIAQWSKDPSTKVGAVLIDVHGQPVSFGFNGLPMYIKDTPERYTDRETKYKMIIHAERNAMLFARRDLTAATLYTWPMMPCAACAGLIIQAGIDRVVAPETPMELVERWGGDMQLATEMFEEAGVALDWMVEDE